MLFGELSIRPHAVGLPVGNCRNADNNKEYSTMRNIWLIMLSAGVGWRTTRCIEVTGDHKRHEVQRTV